MPIYEFACDNCRKIFNFLSKRVNPDHLPTCPACGNTNMKKVVSRFATPRKVKEPTSSDNLAEENNLPMPDFDDPKVQRVMHELEHDIDHLDENNPRHLAYMIKKMKDVLPQGAVPPAIDVAIKRLESGEDPEKIEEDMGEELGQFLGGLDEDSGYTGYSHDPGLYDY